MDREVAEPLPLDLDDWDAWRPTDAAQRLAGVAAPWYIAGGWALDLFLGEQTREHADLEVGVPARSFGEVRRALSGCELFVVGSGQAWPLTTTTLAAHHQTWVRDKTGGPWRMDVLREPWDGDVWIFRRHASVRLTSASLIARTSDGIPYAQPEIVLLFKAKAGRSKDDLDFATVLAHLDGPRRAWLRDALSLVHPGHPWLDALTP